VIIASLPKAALTPPSKAFTSSCYENDGLYTEHNGRR
jgi:hypothetical protein